MATKSDRKSIEGLKNIYFTLRNSLFVYRWIVNFKSTLQWIFLKKKFRKPGAIDITFSKIMGDLDKDGIAFTSLKELFPETNWLEMLQSWIIANETNLSPKNKKKFLLSYFGSGNDYSILDIDLSNPFMRFYLDDKILKIVCEYLGYIPQLNYLTVEKTIPLDDVSPVFSQNWHRDPEEKKTMKVFIYVSDVLLVNGPFIYAKKSQPSSKHFTNRVHPQKLPHGSYPSENDVLQTINSEDIVLAEGKAGTVIFCDTAGLHRGGLAKSGERIMSTAFYPSKKWTEPPLIKKSNLFDSSSLSEFANKIAQ
jgi:hypothetical protein